jgi:hypothetical protein
MNEVIFKPVEIFEISQIIDKISFLKKDTETQNRLEALIQPQIY